MNNDEPLFFAGVDWGSQSHYVCIIDHNGSILKENSFRHSGEGLWSMGEWIIEVTESIPENVAVGIEVTRGPVVESLMARGFDVHSINPKQLDRFRDRFSAAGAKDDRRDAMVIASALRTDGRHFRRLQSPCEDVTILRSLSRGREELVSERNRWTNRLNSQLWIYYPQFKEVVGDDTVRPWNLELWKLAPTPSAARRVRVSSVRKILQRNRIQRIGAEEVLGILRSKEINLPEETISSCVGRIKSIIEFLDVVNRQLKEAEGRIREMLAAIISRQRVENSDTGKPTDVEILLSMQGIGLVTVATLVSEAYDLIRRRDYKALRCVTGAAPVTRQSGKSRYVIRRQTSSRRLQTAIYYWAGVAVLHDPASKARYRSLRERGLRHSRSLRTVADRLLYVACTLLEKGELFDREFKTPPQAAAA